MLFKVVCICHIKDSFLCNTTPFFVQIQTGEVQIQKVFIPIKKGDFQIQIGSIQIKKGDIQFNKDAVQIQISELQFQKVDCNFKNIAYSLGKEARFEP